MADGLQAHLGLGAFHKAHQAFYTELANRAGGDWAISAFTGRRADAADALREQGFRYTVLVRGPESDTVEEVSAIRSAHPGDDDAAWESTFVDPRLAVLTLTVTEAGYRRAPDGGIDLASAAVSTDVDALRSGGFPATAPGRVVHGLRARRDAGGAPITVLPCDNLPDNGEVTRRVLTGLAEAVDPALAEWVGEQVAFASCMVDRITPATTAEDLATVERLTGRRERASVVTEPFSEWVVSGSFPAGRPRWEDVGGRFVDDVGPHEKRKLWLLNGAHSLLAYSGGLRGARTVADAIADEQVRHLVEGWWDLAARYLPLPAPEVAAYRSALLTRWSNPRIRHQLEQIGTDGSQKLPVRFTPVLLEERAAGRLPEPAVAVLAAWVAHLRGASFEVHDDPRWAAYAEGPVGEAVRRVLDNLSRGLGDDAELVAAVTGAVGR